MFPLLCVYVWDTPESYDTNSEAEVDNCPINHEPDDNN
jgi:hypothetical protein